MLHKWRGDATVFEGDYPSWDVAARLTSGYADSAILERTRLAVLDAQADDRVFERDSVILSRPEYSFPVLTALFWAAVRGGGRLDVVDFGGSLGSSFFQFRRFLRAIPDLRWGVVEQPHYVECGSRELAGEGLSFHTTIADALRELRPDVLLVSSVLQYLPTPHSTLEKMLEHEFAYVVLDRTALTAGPRDRLTIQKNPDSISPASYPAWFLKEEGLRNIFRERYRLVYDFPGHDRVLINGPRVYFHGYVFERSDSP